VKIVFHMDGWQKVVEAVVDDVLVPRAEKIADRCNDEMRAEWRSRNPEANDDLANVEDGYVAGTVSIDGGKSLTKRDYRATVITRTYRAMIDNATFDRLVKNLYLASQTANRFRQRVFGIVNESGGATITLDGSQPTEGYAFAPSKTTERKIRMEDWKPEDVDNFVDDNWVALQRRGNHLGLWVDGGYVYIDVSQVGPAARATINAAQAAEQLGVFDLGNFVTIETGKMVDGAFVSVDPDVG
jgi:hypothetical protein